MEIDQSVLTMKNAPEGMYGGTRNLRISRTQHEITSIADDFLYLGSKMESVAVSDSVFTFKTQGGQINNIFYVVVNGLKSLTRIVLKIVDESENPG